jgi:hypothetical protein
VVKKTLKNRHKGDIKAQKKRRKERLKQRPKKSDVKVQLIDGNWSFYPVAFCVYHTGYLTQGLIDTHRCDKRNCMGFKQVIDDEED